MRYFVTSSLALFCSCAVFAAEPMLNFPLAPASPSPGLLVEAAPVAPQSDPARSVVLLPQLRGLTLVSQPDELLQSDSLKAELDTSRISPPDLEGFEGLLQSYLNRPLSVALLDEISAAVVNYYREHDFPVVDAVVPQGQDISEGIAQMVVVVGRLGQLRLSGNHYFSDALLRSYVSSVGGEPLQRSRLIKDLGRLNQNPFRTVNVQLQSGAAFGETDLLLNVEETRPWRVYGGAANTGNSLTGREQYFVGGNWGNAFGKDHQLGYQFTGSNNSSSFRSHTLSYLIPLASGQQISMFAARVVSNPPPDARGFDLEGRNWQAGLRYQVPLQASGSYQHNLEFGADFKRSNNDLQFGTLRVFNTFTDIVQFNATYAGALADALGRTGFSLMFNYSPGGLSQDNADAAFVDSRQDASARYWYTRLSVERINAMPLGMTLSSELQVQYSNRNLLGSEQLGIGGYRSVRGYNEFAEVGDSGWLLRNELRFKGLTLGPVDSRNGGQFQFLWFVDYGAVRSAQPLPGESSISLASTGPALRWSFGAYASLRLDYGYQLREQFAGSGKDQQLHLGLNFGF